jgi:hypothetical protein
MFRLLSESLHRADDAGEFPPLDVSRTGQRATETLHVVHHPSITQSCTGPGGRSVTSWCNPSTPVSSRGNRISVRESSAKRRRMFSTHICELQTGSRYSTNILVILMDRFDHFLHLLPAENNLYTLPTTTTLLVIFVQYSASRHSQ